MNVNVSGIVQVDSVSVSAQVGTKSVNTNATIQQHNTDVSASVEHKTTNVSATAQTRSTNVGADVNPHVIQQNDHSRLLNLDYDNAGHIGFQRALTEDNAGTGISIETDPVTGEVVISNTQTSAEWGNIEGDITDQTDLNNILTGLDNDITAVEDDVDDIQELIPVQATQQNQLADKDFVNSSIATSTATFRETYNVVTDLHLSTSATHQQVATALGNTISVADNNDYCFVEIPTDDLTPTETLQVDRYKYNGSSWSFEYTLNNSGYTSAQWKAINSGITSGKVTQYDGYATSKQDTLIAGTNITIDADGKTISSDIPQATQSVAGKVLLGAAGGAATYESVGDGKPICYPTTAGNVRETTMDLKSSISDNGLKLTEIGFVYSDNNQSPTISDTKAICDLSCGRIEKTLSGLTRNTTYYIKSYGINQGGTSYGDLLTQTTWYYPIPPEYQLVEYLESHGTEWIGYIISGNGFNGLFAVCGKTANSPNDTVIIGRNSPNAPMVLYYNSKHWAIYKNGTGTAGNGITADNNLHTFSMNYLNDGICSIDGVTDYTTTFKTNSLKIGLFCRYNGGTGVFDYAKACKIHKVFISEGNNVEAKLYSVYRISDSKPGMYDIVNNVFYTNQGTGEFTVGPDKQWTE